MQYFPFTNFYSSDLNDAFTFSVFFLLFNYLEWLFYLTSNSQLSYSSDLQIFNFHYFLNIESGQTLKICNLHMINKFSKLLVKEKKKKRTKRKQKFGYPTRHMWGTRPENMSIGLLFSGTRPENPNPTRLHNPSWLNETK